MAEVYSRNMMKVALAKMLQTIGWNSIHSTPLEILTDVMTQYVLQIAKSTHDYANEFGCVEPSLDHLGLAFRDFHVALPELEEYVTYVNFAPAPTPVPKYPVAKADCLNFLKPGSKEVITRQVHIHEHLPPMVVSEGVENDNETPVKTEETIEVTNDETSPPVFKRPADVSPGDSFKRPRLTDEEGRPTREISSVMMTTSGYISPAREGKLPEARTPTQAAEPMLPKATTPPPSTAMAAIAAQNYPPAGAFDSPATPTPPKPKPIKKTSEKTEKKKSSKELFKNGPSPVDGAKKTEKVKRPPKEPKVRKNAQGPKLPKSPSTPKVNKTLAAARMKTEKLNTTITPIPSKIDKLSNEPDKKKANIFKKISNVKTEREVKTPKSIEAPRDPSPEPIIVEEQPEKLNVPSDVTIELVNVASHNDKQPEKLYFDDDSPPGTPSTPKTPELITHPSPPVPIIKEKRKRKDKTKVKKLPKMSSSPIDEMDRPKTPEAHVPQMPPSHFSPLTPFSLFPGVQGVPGVPGLPPQLINSFMPMGQMNANPFFSNPAFMPHPSFSSIIPPLPTQSLPKETHEVKTKVPADSTSAEVVEPAKSPRVEGIKKKKDKKDKIKKKNKKDKIKIKGEKKKLKEEKKEKLKKEKKEKRKEKERDNVNLKLTLKLGGDLSPRPETPEKKLNIKPIVKREPEEREPEIQRDTQREIKREIKREMSPELAKISALVTGQPKPKLSPVVPTKEEVKEEKPAVTTPQRTHPGPGRPRIHPIKPKPLKAKRQPLPVKDSEGNEVWICPTCSRQDDGSPMIGCDDCDAWYHWVCVGIQVPPDETENWYCRQCIVKKKQEVLHTDKKKKRKKREKKEH